MSKIPQEAIETIMEQAQVFASTYSLVGGRFDDGSKMEQSNEEKAELRLMVCTLMADAARAQGAEVEPFMYGIMEPDGSTFWDEDLCVSSRRDELEDILEDRGMSAHKVVALYTAPPAPQPTEREKALEEALKDLEGACEQLAATRSIEIYSAMIDGGQAEALLSLDGRRRAARAALAGGEA